MRLLYWKGLWYSAICPTGTLIATSLHRNHINLWQEWSQGFDSNDVHTHTADPSGSGILVLAMIHNYDGTCTNITHTKHHSPAAALLLVVLLLMKKRREHVCWSTVSFYSFSYSYLTCKNNNVKLLCPGFYEQAIIVTLKLRSYLPPFGGALYCRTNFQAI